MAVASGTNTPNINFVLALPGSLSGIVTRTSDGSPLANVNVYAYLDPSNIAWSAVTSQDGRFSITKLPAGSYRVRTSNTLGYVDEYYSNVFGWDSATLVPVAAGAATSDINFSLVLGGSISGRVTREPDGAALAGIFVYTYSSDGSQHAGGATTGADGTYMITALPSGQYRVHTESSLGYVDEYFDNAKIYSNATDVGVVSGSDTPNINFSLVLGGSISGRVTRNSDGAGLKNVYVYAYDNGWNYVKGVATAADGTYTIPGLAAGSYYIWSYSIQGYASEYYNDTRSRTSAVAVPVSAGSVTPNIGFGLLRLPAGDFDWDGKADISVYRPATGHWYVRPSGSPGSFNDIQWGNSEDRVVAADYSGDGRTDIAVWRPATGFWYILPDMWQPGTFTSRQWGVSGDLPFPADYDGDGRADLAVWRPSNGTWYIIPSTASSTFTTTAWGSSADIPVPADYDGDGKADVAVWRPGNGSWYILPSGAPGSMVSIQWGVSSDIPVPGDYNGDGKAEVAVYRPAAGMWYVLTNAASGAFTGTHWGVSDDVPVPGDYDGDGKADVAVWRQGSGMWYILPSGSPGTYTGTLWGLPTDLPLSQITRILSSMP